MRTFEQIPQLPVLKGKSWRRYLIEGLQAAAGALVVTGIIYAFHLYPTIPNISIVYLLVILILASIYGRYAALVAALVAFISFDFFLVPPFYSFTISRWEEWIALFVFLVTALITSHLTSVMRQSIEQARLRERETRILYEAGRVINTTDQIDEQLDSIALSLVRVFSLWGVRACALLLPDPDGTLRIRADAPIAIESFTLSPDEILTAQDVMAKGNMMEKSDKPSDAPPTRQHAVLRLIPLKAGSQVLGVLCLRIQNGISWFASIQSMQEEQARITDRTTFFWIFLDQAIMIIEQASLRARAKSNNE
jgi:two-component system sensor histidine kinase KdpD